MREMERITVLKDQDLIFALKRLSIMDRKSLLTDIASGHYRFVRFFFYPEEGVVEVTYRPLHTLPTDWNKEIRWRPTSRIGGSRYYDIKQVADLLA
jgi:hypothetical protein